MKLDRHWNKYVNGSPALTPSKITTFDCSYQQPVQQGCEILKTFEIRLKMVDFSR